MEDSLKSASSNDKHLLDVYGNSVIVTYVNSDVAHAKLPHKLVNQTIVPGLAAQSEVEIVIIRNQEVLTESLHLLGSRWLADILSQNANAWLLELIGNSMLMREWDRDLIWIAVPLERKNKLEYCMPMVPPELPLEPLMNCGTAILADQFSGVTENTLSICPNSLTFLMGQCKLGCGLCSLGLGSVTAK